MTIPPAYAAECTAKLEGCAGIIDIREPHHGERISGGVMINREGGGSNYTALPERTGKWICRWCIDKLKAKGQGEQGSLL